MYLVTSQNGMQYYQSTPRQTFQDMIDTLTNSRMIQLALERGDMIVWLGSKAIAVLKYKQKPFVLD